MTARLLPPILLAIAVSGCPSNFVEPQVVLIDPDEMMNPPAGSLELFVSEPSGTLAEGGAPVTVEVALQYAPMAPVTVTVTSSDETSAVVMPTELVFVPENFNLRQTLTISPVDDAVAEDDVLVEIGFGLTSEDPQFTAKPVNPLILTMTDNDTAPELVLQPQGQPVVREDGSLVIDVTLNRQPTSEVLIPVAVSDATQASVGPGTLTFTTLDWNLPQQLMVQGVDDRVKDPGTTFEVQLGPTNSADPAFNQLAVAVLTLTSADGICGNGVVDGEEVCEPDPGGPPPCDYGNEVCPEVCTNACVLVTPTSQGFCGDGQVQAGGGEECDEPTVPCGYGQEACQTCSGDCKRIPGRVTGFCGDGIVQSDQGEACDGPMEPCIYGQMSCTTCDPTTCQEVPGVPSGYCGDGQVQPSETCEGRVDAATIAAQCSSGTLLCDETCTNSTDCWTYEGTILGGDNFTCARLRATGSQFRIGCWGDAPIGVTDSLRMAADASALCRYDRTAELLRCTGGRLGDQAAQTADLIGLESNTTGETLCFIGTIPGESRFTRKLHCISTLADPTLTTNLPMLSFNGLSEIAVGDGFGCVLPDGNRGSAMTCWGAGAPTTPSGQFDELAADGRIVCGLDASTGAPTCTGPLAAAAAAISTRFTDISVHDDGTNAYACASGLDGLRCFGDVPAGVPRSESGRFIRLHVGAAHMCVQPTGPSVQCYGDNTLGQRDKL